MFQNGLMLFGLAAAAVPLVLHFLSRARYRTVDWGAMMFLRGGPDASRRSSSRFRQAALVLVRMAAVGVLAVALARPVVRGAWWGQAHSEQITAAIVLDCSASMSFEENGGRDRFELARGAARQVLAGLRRGDRAVLVLAGYPPAAQDLKPTPELRALDARLADASPAHGRADLPAAMALAWEQLLQHEPVHRQMFVITDRQSLSWRSPDGSGPRVPWLERPADGSAAAATEVFVIPVGGPDADNLVVESIDLSDPPAIQGQPVEFEVRLRNYGPVQRAALPLTLRTGDRTVFETRVHLGPAETATVKAAVKEGFPSAGSQVVSASVASTGGYAADDRLDFVVQVIEPVRVLIVSGDERPAATTAPTVPAAVATGALRSESDFLRVALAPYFAATGQVGRDPCTVDVKPVEQWPGGIGLVNYDVLVLANVEKFEPAQVREIEQFVYGGGGLLVAPGNLSRVDNYNELLYRDGAGLLPAELLPATSGDGSRATALLGWRPDHPVFRFLRGRPDPLPSSTIGRYFPARPRQSAEARSLAEYVSGWPFLVEAPRRPGERRGRVILMTTPLDVDWGNLPYSNFYLPFVQSLARYLCPDAAAGGSASDGTDAASDPRNLAPGDAVVAWFDDAGDVERTVAVVRPPPSSQQPTPLELFRFGEQAEARFTDTSQPGVYRLIVTEQGKAPPRHTRHYVVTPPRDESDLTQLEPDGWEALARSTGFEVVDTAEQPIAAVMSESRDGRELWSLLLPLALGLGLFELALTRAFSRGPAEPA